MSDENAQEKKTMISRIDSVSVGAKKRSGSSRKFLVLITGAEGADPASKYFWQIFSLRDLSRLEIISPMREGSFLSGFLESKLAGVHYIAFQTPNIHQVTAHLKARGIPFFGHYEYPDGTWEGDIHSSSPCVRCLYSDCRISQ